jgi:hypothetical protein
MEKPALTQSIMDEGVQALRDMGFVDDEASSQALQKV